MCPWLSCITVWVMALAEGNCPESLLLLAQLTVLHLTICSLAFILASGPSVRGWDSYSGLLDRAVFIWTCSFRILCSPNVRRLCTSNTIVLAEPKLAPRGVWQHKLLGPAKSMDGASPKPITKLEQRQNIAEKRSFDYPSLKNSTSFKEESLKNFFHGSKMRRINEGNSC